MVACKDYANRPQLCRDFVCDKPCAHCGECCHNALLGLNFPEGTDLGISEDMLRFFDLHGMHFVPEGVFFECVCKHFVEGEG